MPELTTIDACAIAYDFCYLAQMVDDLGHDAEFSRLTFYDAQSVTPWVAHDLQWTTSSVCVWRTSPFGPRVYVALSTEGDVEIVGPGGRPRIIEHIPGAGLNRSWSLGRGLMVKVRQIGDALYACGAGYSVFRRDARKWEELPFRPDPNASAADSRFFYDLDGADGRSLYAVGPSGPATSRIAHYDGAQWRDLASDIPGTLTTILRSGQGGYYVGGSGATLLHGDADRGFSSAGVATTDLDRPLSLAEYGGSLYVASSTGLHSLRALGRPIMPVRTGLDPEQTDTIKLSVAENVLWCFGNKDMTFFDGRTWTRVHDPENPRIGR